MTLDLEQKSNWNKVFGERLIVQYTKEDPSKDKYRYIPLAPIYLTLNSNILLVGAQSDSAKSYYYLGAKVTQYLYVSPSSNSQFTQGVKIIDEKRIKLNNLNLVTFQDYNIYPYLLVVEVPYWLEDAYVEVWEYLGTKLNSVETLLQNLELKLEDV